jgi:uncharacterized membrane protein
LDADLTGVNPRANLFQKHRVDRFSLLLQAYGFTLLADASKLFTEAA